MENGRVAFSGSGLRSRIRGTSQFVLEKNATLTHRYEDTTFNLLRVCLRVCLLDALNPALRLSNICARGEARVQQDHLRYLYRGHTQGLVGCLCNRGTVPIGVPLGIPLYGRPLCSLFDGIFVSILPLRQ